MKHTSHNGCVPSVRWHMIDFASSRYGLFDRHSQKLPRDIRHGNWQCEYNPNAQAKWTDIFWVYNPRLWCDNHHHHWLIMAEHGENRCLWQGRRAHRISRAAYPYDSPRVVLLHCANLSRSMVSEDEMLVLSLDYFWIQIWSTSLDRAGLLLI